MISSVATFLGLLLGFLSILDFLFEGITAIVAAIDGVSAIAALPTVVLIPYSITSGSLSLILINAIILTITPVLIGLLIGVVSLILGVPAILIELFVEIIVLVFGGTIVGGLCVIPILIPCLNVLYLPIGIELFLLCVLSNINLFWVICLFITIHSSLCICVSLNISIIYSIFLLLVVIAETCLATCFVINVLTVTGGAGTMCVGAMFVVLLIITFIYCIVCPIGLACPLCYPFLATISLVYCICFMSVLSCFPPAALPFFAIAIIGAFIFGCVIVPLLLILGSIFAFAAIFCIVFVFDSGIFVCICAAEIVIFAFCQICIWSSAIIMIIVMLLFNLIAFIPALISTCGAALLLACIIAPVLLIIGMTFAILLTMVVTMFRRIIGGGT